MVLLQPNYRVGAAGISIFGGGVRSQLTLFGLPLSGSRKYTGVRRLAGWSGQLVFVGV
ncbi:MAG: hypothetical protein RL417_2386 [Pseudomonadota bacterium]